MLYVLVLLVVGHTDAGLAETSECDEIEINHYYDDNACLVFTQLIGWNYYSEGKHCSWYIMHPHALYQRNGYWNYNHYPPGRLQVIRIRAKVRQETWSQWDHELEDRNHVPIECRPGLPRPLP